MSTGPVVVTPETPAELFTSVSSTPQTDSSSRGILTRATLRLSRKSRDNIIITASVIVGWWVWNMAPAGGMELDGMHFLATLTVAVTLWVLEVFDEYIVGLMLLLTWVVLGIVPSKVALAGFSENSWFFTIGALGIAAGIGQTQLLQRLSLRLLGWIPIQCHKSYALLLLSSGILSGPLLPTGKARASVAVPVSQAISDAAGFEPRSNGSAAVSLSAFIGFSQMSFMFLTAGEQCLIAWNFLPPPIKAEFGWLSWFVAALPAAVCISLFLFFAVHFLLPLSTAEKVRLLAKGTQPENPSLGPITKREWITLATLLATVAGWLTTSWHGVNEAWVALAALLVFLLTGILDKNGFKNKIDWGLILFFGVLNSMAVVAGHLKVDLWFMSVSGPFLAAFTHDPLSFLIAVFVLVSMARMALRKTPVAALFALTVLPLSSSVGIHPGVLLVAVLMAAECFILGYQDGPYQIAYAGNGGAAFSHRQARRVLGARYVATLLAIIVSVPYWKWLGFID